MLAGLSKGERALRHVMIFWGNLFMLASVGFIVPAMLQRECRRVDVFLPLNLMSGYFRPRRRKVSRVANDREDFWLVLAMSNMALVTLFSVTVAMNPHRYKHLSVPLMISKANSGLLYLLFYLKTGKIPYLIAAFFDWTPFLTILSAYRKAL